MLGSYIQKLFNHHSCPGVNFVSKMPTMLLCEYLFDILHDSCLAAEDWLNPSAVLEIFEARAARMSVSGAQRLSNFTNPEEGTA